METKMSEQAGNESVAESENELQMGCAVCSDCMPNSSTYSSKPSSTSLKGKDPKLLYCEE